jgi:hypothetical protein
VNAAVTTDLGGVYVGSYDVSALGLRGSLTLVLTQQSDGSLAGTANFDENGQALPPGQVALTPAGTGVTGTITSSLGVFAVTGQLSADGAVTGTVKVGSATGTFTVSRVTVQGTFVGTFKTATLSGTLLLTLQMDGANVTGTATVGGPLSLPAGTVTATLGATGVTGTINLTIGQVPFQAKLDGDSLTGTMTVPGNQQGTFDLRRLADASGTFNGNYTLAAFGSGQLVLTLAQNGLAVTGTVMISGGVNLPGTIAGTIDPATGKTHGTITLSVGTVTFDSTLSASGEIDGTLALGGATGTFTATRAH